MAGLSLTEAIGRFPVITCDVFDTALMRRLARPEDIALLTGVRAAHLHLIECSAETFRGCRLEAERAMRAQAEQAGRDEVRLAEIYQHLAACGVIEDPIQFAELELAVERAASAPVEAIRSALSILRPEQRLVFLSDTVLSGAAIASLLHANGYGADRLVIASADTGLNKASGRLFAHAIAQLGVAATDILHIGDNPMSDIKRAAEHGVATFHVPYRQPTPERPAVARLHPVARLANSVRRARATATPPGFPHHIYGAMLLIGFTLFVLAQARRRGIKRIHFLARDGHIPLAIARRLIARTGETFELSYLHVSRHAIAVPERAGEPARLAQMLGEALQDRPMSAALTPIGLDAAATAPWLRALGIDPNSPLNPAGGMAPIERLLAAGGSMVADRLRHIRETALGYLRQEGFCDPGPRMIVDVGWRGSTQTALARLAGVPVADLFGCYVGLWPEALTPELNPNTAAGYLFAFGAPRDMIDPVRDGYALLELFLSAPHAPVAGYAHNGARIEPVLADEAEPRATMRRETMQAIERGVLDEFDALDRLLDGAWPREIDPESALHDMRQLLTRPTRHEVTAFNRIPFIHGIGGGHSVPPINPLPLHELLLHPTASLQRLAQSSWRAGAVRAALPWPIPDMTFADFEHRLRRLLGRA